ISTHGLDTQSSATQLLRLLISESRHERLVFMAQVQANITALTAKYLHHTTKLIYGPVDLQQIKSWTDKMVGIVSSSKGLGFGIYQQPYRRPWV
ncbi:hypothetical protein SARC_10319, partial [Sphaeroforma arctica JP610]